MKRCEECGSWDAECVSDTPVAGCGCARCLRAALAEAQAENARLRDRVQVCKHCGHETFFRYPAPPSEAESVLVGEVVRLRAELASLTPPPGCSDLELQRWRDALVARYGVVR